MVVLVVVPLLPLLLLLAVPLLELELVGLLLVLPPAPAVPPGGAVPDEHACASASAPAVV
jgi:hypothetical protein